MNDRITLYHNINSLPRHKNSQLVIEFLKYFNTNSDGSVVAAGSHKPAGIITTIPKTKTIYLNPDIPTMVGMTAIREFVCRSKSRCSMPLDSNIFEEVKTQMLTRYKGDCKTLLYIIHDMSIEFDRTNVIMNVDMRYSTLEIVEFNNE